MKQFPKHTQPLSHLYCWTVAGVIAGHLLMLHPKAIGFSMRPLLRYPRLLFFLLFFCFASLHAQDSKIRFTHLTNLDGLSQSTVQAIVKDKYGFMWFGTQDGLNRYDGYNFKVYRHEPNKPGSLRRSHIISLYEDRQGNLWVGTNNGGLSLYDRRHDSFIHFKESSPGYDGLSQKSVTTIYEDKQNNLWIGTYWKLNLLNRKTGKITQFGNDPDNPASISENRISSIFEDSKNNLWVGTAGGLNLLDRKTKKFRRYVYDSNKPGSLSSDKVQAIQEDGRGRLWIGTDNGLNLFNAASETFTHYKKNENDPASIVDNVVMRIENAGDGKIWIGTTSTLELFDPAKGTFVHFQNDQFDGTSLKRNGTIMSMLQDKEGILWVGTYQGCISKYDKNLNYFDVYRNNPLDVKSLGFNSVTSFAEGPGGNIWIGTDGGGLNLWKRSVNEFVNYLPEQGNKYSIDGWSILCLAQSKKNGWLWMGTFGHCIERYDPKTNTFKHYYKGTAPDQLNNDAVYALREDAKGNIWMGTNGGGVNVLDTATGLISKYITDPNNPASLAGDFVRCFFDDKKGNTWIGTTNGVSVFKPGVKGFTRYDQSNTGWESDLISSIIEDSKGNMWIGTQGGGLVLLDPQTRKITNYTNLNGLPSNTINTILEDNAGFIWLSTNNGISRFDPVSKSFKNNPYNDLRSFEFLPGAGFKTARGEIFLGGVNGFNAFIPGNLKVNEHIPPVVVTGFKLFNKPVIVGEKNAVLQQDITQTKEITLSYDQSIITFEFSALGFTAPEKNQYAFMLEGFDKKWNYVGEQRTATYTNLDAGTYTFRVKGSNNDGVWNERGTSIKIIVLPPFWLTWWFRLLIFLLVAGGVFSFYKFRMKLIKNQTALLEKKVKQQTTQLVHLNEEERKARLQSEEARTGSEIARQETARANESLQIKNKELEQFVYVASHDLQEPLRTISGFVELVQQQYQGKLDLKADKYLDFILDATGRMKVLINDLLDFSRIGKKAELKMIDCNILLKDMLADITAAVEEAGAEIQYAALPVIIGYPTEMKLLFQNLVTNALKFSRKDTPPLIKISAQKIEGYWQFAVSDNGIGIEQKHSERIFEIFQRLHTRKEYAGSGIGLSHCKKIVELHDGKIWVESIAGEGSTFYFTIAVKKKVG